MKEASEKNICEVDDGIKTEARVVPQAKPSMRG
jgi:hypothetical protein